MIEVVKVIVTIAGALGAVALGWFLNEKSRASRENKAAVGRALMTLLLSRRRLAGIKVMSPKIASMTPHLSQLQLQLLLTQLMPRFVGWEKEYAAAVDYLAGMNPLLAITVHTAGLRANFNLPIVSNDTSAVAAFDDFAQKILDPSALDEAIEWLAQIHGKSTLKEVRKEIQFQNEPNPVIEEWVDRMLTFAEGAQRASEI